MNISFTSIAKILTRFLERFHIVIFVITIMGGLAVIVLLLNNVIVTSGESGGYTSNSNNANFDQATINQIKQLKTRGEADGQLDLSKGRTNPFTE
jgi:hypothetical protein